ncbi:hypothetical protein SAMN05216410_0330 [Sanguibacter gelidistatuariae]|uniref:Magnesium transporter NIPA n=1 Tax=Sanguibacter gelidistatuariae TaxID=1814289 RepID=A0A1G6GNV5_9MICO|nr:DMT family transporter [Sanguibacter gelidistatuariae]SDB83692.1 hypothetical protein SAMN05216410_0330 [Sanguibacter gelidistatuariae]
MSASLTAPVLLALGGSFLFALGSATLQRAAQTVPDAEARGLRLILRLVRMPLWWLGLVADVAGYALQALALAVGSLLVVQPLVVTSLLFALPLAARWSGRRLRVSDGVWALVLVTSLAAFMVVGAPTSGGLSPGLAQWRAPGLLVAVLLAACFLGAGRRSSARKALLLGTAAGVLYGVLAALTKTLVDVFDHSGVLAALGVIVGSWQLWVLVAVSIAGTVIQQSAFQAGPLSASMPAVTVAEPVVAVGLGLAVYGDTLNMHGLRGLVIIVVGAAMAVATIMLAAASAEAAPAEIIVGP